MKVTIMKRNLETVINILFFELQLNQRCRQFCESDAIVEIQFICFGICRCL